jgi:hypothetical protein
MTESKEGKKSTNLLLLKQLLPTEYKVLGVPKRVLVISPFKTAFGYVDATITDLGDKYMIENNDIAYKFQIMNLGISLEFMKDFSSLPLKFEKDRVYFYVPKEGSEKDLINLAKAVDTFIKDMYDFLRNILSFPEVRQKVGGIVTFLFKFEEYKKKQREKLKKAAEKIRLDIVDIFEDIKSLLLMASNLLRKGEYEKAKKVLDEAIHKLALFDHLRHEYWKITKKPIYEFHANILRSTILDLKKQLENE